MLAQGADTKAELLDTFLRISRRDGEFALALTRIMLDAFDKESGPSLADRHQLLRNVTLGFAQLAPPSPVAARMQAEMTLQLVRMATAGRR